MLVFSWKTFGSRPGRRAHLPRESLEDVNYKKRNLNFIVFLNGFTSPRLCHSRWSNVDGIYSSQSKYFLSSHVEEKAKDRPSPRLFKVDGFSGAPSSTLSNGRGADAEWEE